MGRLNLFAAPVAYAKHTPEGKLDFHACRVAYINLVIDEGSTVKEAQTLARHATPELTINTYGRARQERLHEAVEWMGGRLFAAADHATFMQAGEEGGKTKSATPLVSKELRLSEMVEAATTLIS